MAAKLQMPPRRLRTLAFLALKCSCSAPPATESAMPDPLRLTLYENYRFVLYAPFYAAHAIGAYADEGLEVELKPSPGPGKAEAALVAGEVDVIWMGPIRVMKHHHDN